VSRDFTSCHVCGEKTAMLHTKLCDRCYNIQANIRRAPRSVREWVAKGCPGPAEKALPSEPAKS